ncbi:unnamed protein product, partial [Phaeothamnion confervicola]
GDGCPTIDSATATFDTKVTPSRRGLGIEMAADIVLDGVYPRDPPVHLGSLDSTDIVVNRLGQCILGTTGRISSLQWSSGSIRAHIFLPTSTASDSLGLNSDSSARGVTYSHPYSNSTTPYICRTRAHNLISATVSGVAAQTVDHLLATPLPSKIDFERDSFSFLWDVHGPSPKITVWVDVPFRVGA